jgi:hypothetical protein
MAQSGAVHAFTHAHHGYLRWAPQTVTHFHTSSQLAKVYNLHLQAQPLHLLFLWRHLKMVSPDQS